MSSHHLIYEELFASSTFDHRKYSDIVKIASYIKSCIPNDETPEVGIICGSGFSELGDAIKKPFIIPYNRIPGFPLINVPGHKSNIIFGYYGGRYVLCLQGRLHPYEYNMDLAFCAFPVRLMHLIGVKTVILTSAVGGINKNYRKGDIMLVKDHISFPMISGHSPLLNLNGPEWGSRFLSLHNIYDANLRKIFHDVAKKQSIKVHEGVYVMCGGPQYESGAEIDFCRTVGGDVVGMSLCHEALVGRQCNMKILGLAIVSNIACSDADPSHFDVLETVNAVGYQINKLLDEFISQLPV